MFELFLVPALLVAIAVLFRNYPAYVIAFVASLLCMCIGLSSFIWAYFALAANKQTLSDALVATSGVCALGMIAIFVVLILY